MSGEPPIVHLVDDEPDVLRAVARMLRAAGWATASFDSPHRFLEEHDPARPGCVVLDLAMPGVDGLELQEMLNGGDSGRLSRPVVFLTGRAEVPDSVRAMKGGAVDFLTKPVDGPALLDAVRRAVDEDLRARRAHADEMLLEARLDRLTPREREVMGHVVAGEPNKVIAATLGTSEKTIKVHRARVMEKMEVGSLAELVRISQRVFFITE